MVVHLAAFPVRALERQIAVHDEVAVVGPRPRRAHRVADEGIEVEVRIGRREGFHVLAKVELQRRLAVAEQVVGRAVTPADVAPTDPLGRPRRIVDQRRRGGVVALAAKELVGIVGEQVIVPHATLQRQPAGRPLILTVERCRHKIADQFDGRRAGAAVLRRLRQLIGYAVVELKLHERREVVIRLARIVEAALIPELHVVRARDVRDRRPVMRQPADQMMVVAAADARGRPGVQVRDLAVLNQRSDHPGIEGAVHPGAGIAVPRLVTAPAGL